MKITKSQLKQIIKEEIKYVLAEGGQGEREGPHPVQQGGGGYRAMETLPAGVKVGDKFLVQHCFRKLLFFKMDGTAVADFYIEVGDDRRLRCCCPSMTNGKAQNPDRLMGPWTIEESELQNPISTWPGGEQFGGWVSVWALQGAAAPKKEPKPVPGGRRLRRPPEGTPEPTPGR